MARNRNRRKRYKTERREVEARIKLKPPENTKELKSFFGAIQYITNFLPKLSEQTDRLRKGLKKDEPWKWDRNKKRIGEIPILSSAGRQIRRRMFTYHMIPTSQIEREIRTALRRPIKNSKRTAARKNGTSEGQNENRKDLSKSNKTFENTNNVNKLEQSVRITSGQSEISHLCSSRPLKLNSKVIEKKKLSWEIMNLRKRNKIPETRTHVEQRNTLSRPRTLRKRHDPHSQRTILAHSRPNKHSREQIAEIDADLLQRTN